MFHYFFDSFCLQADRQRLLKYGEEIRLQRKAFLVLEQLLQDAPLPVDTEKFKGRVWKNASPADLMRSLGQTIYLLRRALGDTGPEYRFIKNRTGWAYEFALSVDRRLPSDPPPNVEPDRPIELKAKSRPLPESADANIEPAHPAAIDQTVNTDEPVPEAPNVLSQPTSTISATFVLRSKIGNPRLADFRDIKLPRPGWILKCRMRSDAAYYRFGFKFLTASGRLFGDTTIESRDENLVVHVGRNNWNRKGISNRDLFLSAYRDGARLDLDRRILRVSKGTPVEIRLSLNRDHGLEMQVDGSVCFLQFIPPSIARRVLVMAWGDHDDCQVELTQFSIHKSSRQRS